MRLWKVASGALKDQNSILLASMGRRSGLRHPEIEAAVIKATTHDQYPIHPRYVDRLNKWIPTHVKAVLLAITMRVQRTRSWEVALKALMLTHRFRFTFKIGRLPFDLSGFTDAHSSPEKMWAQNAFVRSYFAFLDHPYPYAELEDAAQIWKPSASASVFSVSQDLALLQNLQGLLDILLQVRPHPEVAAVPLVAEATHMILLEVYDVYRRICNGVARVLLRIYTAGKSEAKVALRVVQKATVQGEALGSYLELMNEVGLMKDLDCPKVKHIPEEDIRELEDIINKPYPCMLQDRDHDQLESKSGLKTVITQRWERFDDNDDQDEMHIIKIFASSTTTTNYCHHHPYQMPDLITFSNLLSV